MIIKFLLFFHFFGAAVPTIDHTMPCKTDVDGCEEKPTLEDAACKADVDCPSAAFCSSVGTCNKYASEGMSCGGFMLPELEQRCDKGLKCDYSMNDPLIADIPGICKRESSEESSEGCGDVMCAMYCAYGFEVNAMGCEICKCKEKLTLEDAACKADVDCPSAAFCSSVGTCNKYASEGMSCGGFMPPELEQRCDKGLKCDYSMNDPHIADIPGICKREGCNDVMCEMYCAYGFEVDAMGCEICKCKESTTDRVTFNEPAACPVMRGIGSGAVQLGVGSRSDLRRVGSFVPLEQLPCTLTDVHVVLELCSLREGCLYPVRVKVQDIAVGLSPWPVQVVGKNDAKIVMRWVPISSCLAQSCVTLPWKDATNVNLPGSTVPQDISYFSNALDAKECYCDDACTRYKDCCYDYQVVCRIGQNIVETLGNKELGDMSHLAGYDPDVKL